MSNFTISSSYPVPSVMSRTEFEDIIKNLVPAGDLVDSSNLQISNSKIAIKAAGVGFAELDLSSTNSNISNDNGAIKISPTMTGLTSVTSTSFTGALTGNASTATALQTSRTISLGGDLSGSASFDGTSDITLDATVDVNSVALGADTTGNYVAAGATSGNGISGSVSSEGGTFTVTSNATSANTGSTIVLRDSSGNFTAGTITAALTGNASSATTLSAYGTAGQILATNSSANAVEWVDNTPTLEALTDTNIGTITDGSFLYYDGTSGQQKWKNTSDIKLNDSNGHVAIGASLSNSYRLRVGGSTLIEGDGTTSTELQVEDDTASATFRLYGQTYALEDLTTKYGNAQIQLSTLNAVDISSIGVSGSTATVTTSANHYFYTGDNITLAGVSTSSGSSINGTHTITKTGDTTFTLDDFNATGGSYSGGTAECLEGNVSILKNDGTYTYLQIGDRPTRTGAISNAFTPIQFRHTSGDVYINNGGRDSDLRVESVNNSSILHTDAARNCVGIGRSGSRPIFFGHTRNASFNIDAQYSVSSEVCTVTPANPVSHLQVFDTVRITASNGTLTESGGGSKDYTVTSVTMSGDNVSAFTFNTPGKSNTTNSDMVFGIQRHSADYTFGRNRPSAYIRDSGGIDNSQTGTLTVNQTATFPDQGCLKIGNEQLVYNSKTSNTFNITERGALWTTSEAHAYDAYITVTDLSYERDYGWGHLGKGLNFAGGMNLSFQAKINDHQSLNEDVFQALTISKTRLRSAVSSTDTTIPVDSVAEFPSTNGTIRIEQETISYTSVTTTSGSESFNGCTRGTSATTAVAHINNCLVTNSTSTSCGIIEAPSQAHLAIALRGNDEGDGFHIVAPKGGVASGDWITQEDDEGSSANWEYTPYNLFKVTSKYIVINEHAQNIDFRVEGQTGDLFKTDAGTDDVLMPLLVAQNYADNSAAATGGIPVGGLYHTNGTVKIRTS
tara:strand:- start:80 stop:2959 length:2880 start_codon:yes stop_codon:yes gene_type:complete